MITDTVGDAVPGSLVHSGAVRILVVSAFPPWPLSHGGALVLHHQLSHLSGRHAVTLLAASRPPTGASIEGDTLPGVDVRWFGPARAGVTEYARRRWLSLRTGEPADVFRVEVTPLLDALRGALAERPDVVHLHGWGTAQLGRLVGGLPTVHVPIDAWQAGYGTQFAIPRWRRAIETGQAAKVRRHEARHYPRLGAVVVVSDVDAGVLRAAAPGARVEVVPNGVDLGAAPGPTATEPVLGFHGNLASGANCEAAVRLVTEILPRVRRHRPDARVVLIGRDPPAELLRLAGDGVEVTGAVDDVRTALAGVSVYVAPMTSGTGIKNKVLEAMAAGLPVVGTTMAFHGIGTEAGLVADGDDELATAVVGLLDDEEARHRLGRAGRDHVSSFRWADNAAAIETLWQTVMAAR